MKITTQSVKVRLNEQKGYKESFCCHKTLNSILNRLGYGLKKVLKCKPLKKIPETDAIFDNVSVRHQEAKQDNGILRISIDTKAIVKIGELSRGGSNRLQTPLQTCDHDQHWDSILIPFGIHEINHDHVNLYFGNSSSTAHFIVDALEQWYEDRKEQLKDYHTIMIDADNGKPNASNSGFFMERMVTFCQKINKKIQLVYYPPYHSKYNPIERFWAILEKYWSGCILDSVENTFNIVQNVKYKGHQVSSKLVDKIYQKTKVYNKKDWVKINPFIKRRDEIEKWDVLICPFN